jgi:hypothetical protein
VWSDVAQAVNGRPGEWAGEVIPPQELVALLARFGMIVELDTSPGADKELQSAQMAHALAGAAEAHATRAEQAYRDAGAQPPDLTQASLMAFAGVNCQNEVDELTLISWRATRLAGVLGALDFPGPIPRKGEIGSGDALIHTMRLVAAALCGMATAAHTSANPHRGPGEATQAGQALVKAMGALEQAVEDVHRHRAIGDLMGMTDCTRRGRPRD